MPAKQVLIVEDERPIREMIAFGLKRAGFEVREAEDCRAARAALADQLTNIEPTLLPRASDIARLAIAEVHAGRMQAPETAVPTYIRNDVAKPKAP